MLDISFVLYHSALDGNTRHRHETWRAVLVDVTDTALTPTDKLSVMSDQSDTVGKWMKVEIRFIL